MGQCPVISASNLRWESFLLPVTQAYLVSCCQLLNMFSDLVHAFAADLFEEFKSFPSLHHCSFALSTGCRYDTQIL